MQIGDRKFSCWSSHGQENIFGALAHSCNIFFYNLGLRLGPQLITKYAQKFGFGQRTGIDLNGESTGYLPYSLWERIKRQKTWFSGDTANLSIGQGEVLVTPLQVARMMAAVANGGKLIQPMLLESIKDEGKILEPQPAQIIDLALSEENLRIIREGLARAVSDSQGTAHVLADVGISIAGKTGTAQAGSGRAHGWFAGYFPADKPKFVICVFLEHSGTGLRSCLLAKKIIKRMLAEGLL
jgi:penicillin-binding protein 2